MKILYLSCHSILEYDECRIFEALGYDYFSLGSYIDPKHPVDNIRPPLSHNVDQQLLSKAPLREKLTKEFVDNFDIVIVMDIADWITTNWDVIKHKKVIWRTIGQSTPAKERLLAPYRADGLYVLRYSPREEFIQDNIGFDAMIRFYKDPKEFYGWVGGGTEIITINQNMKVRAEFCNYDAFVKAVDGFRATLYGRSNEASGALSGGELTYEVMKQKYRDARGYVYTGTQPASYTLNFIEAFMTGAPIVALGNKFYSKTKEVAGDVYEVPDFIHNGINGFVGNSIEELRDYLSRLVKDVKLARYISKNGRDTAIDLFGMDKIMGHWKKFLEGI